MMTGLFARTAADAVKHEAPDPTKLRYTVIVSRDRPELFDEMIRRFQNSPDTSVIFDRRAETTDSGRRRAIDADLWVAGYTIIRSS